MLPKNCFFGVFDHVTVIALQPNVHVPLTNLLPVNVKSGKIVFSVLLKLDGTMRSN